MSATSASQLGIPDASCVHVRTNQGPLGTCAHDTTAASAPASGSIRSFARTVSKLAGSRRQNGKLEFISEDFDRRCRQHSLQWTLKSATGTTAGSLTCTIASTNTSRVFADLSSILFNATRLHCLAIIWDRANHPRPTTPISASQARSIVRMTFMVME
ncbi:hypothetical protein MRB53_041317 [Persea americana]|nr:hypothetical protein MRB53_041317 [Persea americana]